MKKQTAVERLKEFYMSPLGHDPLNLLLAFEKAMEWEKIQIERAFIDGEQNVWDRQKEGYEFEYAYHELYYKKNYQKSDMPEIEKMAKDLSIFDDLASMLRPK
tara:strand:- start:236 stop:544 length:309 start_codon:yes stop_codon:yes gene_type:complete